MKKDQLISAAGRGDLNSFKTLIRDGADIEQDGHQCLMMACRNDRDEIVSYLIQSGVDIAQPTVYGHCAKDICAVHRSAKCLKLLKDNGDQLNPSRDARATLLMACHYRSASEFEHLLGSPSRTRAAKIEALEYMGAMCVKKYKFQRAYRYWLRSLEESAKAEPCDLLQPKSDEKHPAYGNQFKTVEDLDRIASSREDMWMQALIVTEQMKGLHYPGDYYSLADEACQYLQEVNYKRCISITMYILDRQFHLRGCLDEEMGLPLSTLYVTIESLMSEDPPVPYEEVIPLLSKGVHVTELAMRSPIIYFFHSVFPVIDEAMLLVLYSIAFLVKFKPQMSEMDRINFDQLISKFVHLNPRNAHNMGPLHLACTYMPSSFPILKVVDLLLQAGSNPQAVDNDGNTPLHLMAMDRHPAKHHVIKLMLSESCSCVFRIYNKKWKRFTDCLPSEMVGELEKPPDFCTLRCLSAKAVVNYNIPFDSILPTCLTKLVNVHAFNA